MSARPIMKAPALAWAEEIERKGKQWHDAFRGEAIISYEAFDLEVQRSYLRYMRPSESFEDPVLSSERRFAVEMECQKEREEKKEKLEILFRTLRCFDFLSEESLAGSGSIADNLAVFYRGNCWNIEIGDGRFFFRAVPGKERIPLPLEDAAHLSGKNAARDYLERAVLQRERMLCVRIAETLAEWLCRPDAGNGKSRLLRNFYEGEKLFVTDEGFRLQVPGRKLLLGLTPRGVFDFISGKTHFGIWRLGKLADVSRVVGGW